MTDDLRALLIPPQEARLRSRFGLDGVPLKIITSGWHRLVVVAPDRVFAFPRHQGKVPMLEREADVLSSLDVDFASRLLRARHACRTGRPESIRDPGPGLAPIRA
jgi:hypothetical protein